MRMTQDEFDREKQYQVVMRFVRKMLTDGLISEEEYYHIDTKYRQKLRPITGDLLSGKSLLCSPGRVNMSLGKGA